LNGAILANGGDRAWSSAIYGGGGSGSLQALGAPNSEPTGCIRIGSYLRSLTASFNVSVRKGIGTLLATAQFMTPSIITGTVTFT
jgi:hypothetical protein